MTDDASAESDPTKGSPHWLRLVIAYRLFIGAFLSIALIGVIVFLWLNGVPTVELGQNTKVALFALFLSIPVGALLARPIVSWLYDTNHRYLVVLGLEDQPGIWKLSPTAWSSLDVIEGELHEFDMTKEPLYSARSFDPDDLEARGTWRGTLSDREMLYALSKIDECRGILERDAKVGFAIETQAFTIIRAGTRHAVKSVVDTFEAGTLPDQGDGLDDAIDDAIAQFDLNKQIEQNVIDDESDLAEDEDIVDLIAVDDLVNLGKSDQEAPADD